MTFVILYTNDRTVQEHRVYCLVSRVNIFLQEKVQRLTPTSPMQVSTVVLYYIMRVPRSSLWVSISFMWGIVGVFPFWYE